MTSDRILGAGVYRLMAEEYRAGLTHHRDLIAEGQPDPATHAADAAALAAHLAIAEAVLSTARPVSVRRRRWWWPW